MYVLHGFKCNTRSAFRVHVVYDNNNNNQTPNNNNNNSNIFYYITTSVVHVTDPQRPWNIRRIHVRDNIIHVVD